MVTVVRPLAAQQVIGTAGQVGLLVALCVGVGLGPVGWAAGIVYTAGLWILLVAAVRRAGAVALGPADLVTLTRAVLVGGVTALVAEGLSSGGSPHVAYLVAMAAVALVLDAVDGQVARRSGTVSALGARFDMEVDSFLVLVLSVHVAAVVGPWVLAIGVMRYAFVAAGRAAPWMRAPLPARYATKTVAALQGIVLVVVAAGILPAPLAGALAAVALTLLVWSFGRDLLLLRRKADLRRVRWDDRS